jgi:hypothetical protein
MLQIALFSLFFPPNLTSIGEYMEEILTDQYINDFGVRNSCHPHSKDGAAMLSGS